MRKTIRWLAGLLALILLTSLLPVSAYELHSGLEDYLVEPAEEEPQEEPSVREEPTLLPTEAADEEEEAEPEEWTTDEPRHGPETEPSQSPTEKPTQAPTEKPTQAPSEEPTKLVYPVVDPSRGEQERLNLKYDDRYSFAEARPDYVIYSVNTVSVLSYQVDGGRRTGSRDTAVLKQTDGLSVSAVGTGTASVVLILKEDQVKLNRGVPVPVSRKEPVYLPCIRVKVTVKPARLTLMLLAGQSNMEGLCNGYGKQVSPTQSVACTPGTVYSSYVPAASNTKAITGLDGVTPLVNAGRWASGVSAYLPGSLAGTQSLSGRKLAYPLTALTTEGKGKTGPDSGLGYEWNRLTGDKVWLVNAAWSGSSIRRWQPGTVCYERARAAFVAAKGIYQAEIEAGHYTAGRRLMFWLQGEFNRTIPAQQYRKLFLTMQSGLRTACSIQYTGIISVRAGNDSTQYRGIGDLQLTGPRIAQYALAYDQSRPNILMVSNANEEWVTNRGVRQYFSAAYPEGRLSYPLRRDGNATLPGYESDLHPGVHFTQVGHNENGITAARGMYESMRGSARPQTVVWRGASGKALSYLTLRAGKETQVIPVVSPVSTAKRVRIVSGVHVSYSLETGVLSGGTAASVLSVESNGRTLSRLQVAPCAVPGGIEVSNEYGGVQVSWNSVKGAARYRVFYRQGSGRWTAAGDTRDASLLVAGLQSGQRYSFTVCCINRAGTETTSGYDAQGREITYVQAPVIQSATAGQGRVRLTWNPCRGAAYYRVYYRRKGGGWKPAGGTAGTSFTAKPLAKGVWYFTVRCTAADRKTFVSGFDPEGTRVRVRQ